MKINRIVELYKLKNMTQESLANEIGMSTKNLNFILMGKQEIRASVIEKLAKLFNVKAGYFFDDFEEINLKILPILKYKDDHVKIINHHTRIKDLEDIIKSKDESLKAKDEIIALQKILLSKKC